MLCCDATCSQMAIYESILASPHRTLDGEEADFFVVPVLDSCIITRANDAPHLNMHVRVLIAVIHLCIYGNHTRALALSWNCQKFIMEAGGFNLI